MGTTFSQKEWLDFSFNGHWASEYGLIRVSDGTRYNDNVLPTLTDKTVDIPGGDGQLFFNTYYKQRQFSVSVAFDGISADNIRSIRNWLNGKVIGDLKFPERKGDVIDNVAEQIVYKAKVTGTPSLKYLPIEENNLVVYKGEGTIQFSCYDPFGYGETARTTTSSSTTGIQVYGNYDTPATVTLQSGGIGANTTFTIQYKEGSNWLNLAQIKITTAQMNGGLKWNTNTGLVTSYSGTPIPFTGTSTALLPVGKNVCISVNSTSITPTLSFYNRYL